MTTAGDQDEYSRANVRYQALPSGAVFRTSNVAIS